MTPLLSSCAAVLDRVWPNDPQAAPNAPAFLTSQALADPATALDLLPKELARLIFSLKSDASGSDASDPEGHVAPAFIQLGAAIENFCVRLASENQLHSIQSQELQRYRAWLHTIRHIGEAVGEFADAFAALSPGEREVAKDLQTWLQSNIDLAAEATATLDPAVVAGFHERSKPHSQETRELRAKFAATLQGRPEAEMPALSALGDDFDIAAWLIHRISKLETKILPSQSASLAVSAPRASSSKEISSGG